MAKKLIKIIYYDLQLSVFHTTYHIDAANLVRSTVTDKMAKDKTDFFVCLLWVTYLKFMFAILVLEQDKTSVLSWQCHEMIKIFKNNLPPIGPWQLQAKFLYSMLVASVYGVVINLKIQCRCVNTQNQTRRCAWHRRVRIGIVHDTAKSHSMMCLTPRSQTLDDCIYFIY